MALQKQVIPIPFAQGVDTKSDPKQVVPGKMLTLFNGVFQSAKRILKRSGFAPKSKTTLAGGTIVNGIGSFSYQDELDMVDGSNFYSYSPETDRWANLGEMIPTEINATEIISNTVPFVNQDSAYHSDGYYGYVYTVGSLAPSTTNPMFFAVKDAVSGALLSNTQLTGANVNTAAKVVAIGNYLVAVYSEVPSTTDIKYRAVNVSAPSTVIGPVTIATDFESTPTLRLFDVCVVNNNLYLIYNSTNPGDRLAAHIVDPTLSVSVRFSAASGANYATGGLAITGDSSNNIWFVYNDQAAETRVSVFTEFFFSFIFLNVLIPGMSTADIVNAAIIVLGTTAHIYVTICPTTIGDVSRQSILTNTITIAGTPGVSSSSFMIGCLIYSKPFIFNNKIFVPSLYSSLLQPTVFIIYDMGVSNPLRGRVIAKLLSSAVYYAIPGSSIYVNTRPPMPNTNLVSSGFFELASLSSSTIGAFNGVTISGNSLTSSSIRFSQAISDATLASDLHLSGGMLWMYDSQNIVEHGFNVFPDYITLTDQGAGTGSMSAGTYEYAVTYDWIDAKGNHHRSAPSPLGSVVVAANTSSVQVKSALFFLTAKKGVVASVFRTSANGTTPRRVTPFGGINAASSIGGNIGDYHDTVSDAVQAGGDILYTQGGEVENIAVPAVSAITTFRSRLIAFTSEVTTSFWYSKEVVPSFPVEFSDIFTQSIDELGGPIVSGIQMDDKLIIFKSKNIFYMTGAGPSPAGTNNDFSTPLLINSDVGCTDKNSVILMPNGVMFKSSKGIYLIDRSLSVSYVGADVETYNSIAVTSATLMKAQNQVRFTLASGAVTLVYDYYFQQWSVFSNISAVDSCIFEGNHTYLKSDGTVMEETPGLYLDDTSQIPLSGRTSWLSFAGIQGFQRIYKALFLGQQKGDHSLLISVAYDFDSTFVQTDTIDATAISPTVYQWRIFPVRQKCEAIQFSFVDSQIAPFNEGFSISDLTLEVGVKTGADKLPASQSFG